MSLSQMSTKKVCKTGFGFINYEHWVLLSVVLRNVHLLYVGAKYTCLPANLSFYIEQLCFLLRLHFLFFPSRFDARIASGGWPWAGMVPFPRSDFTTEEEAAPPGLTYWPFIWCPHLVALKQKYAKSYKKHRKKGKQYARQKVNSECSSCYCDILCQP